MINHSPKYSNLLTGIIFFSTQHVYGQESKNALPEEVMRAEQNGFIDLGPMGQTM